MVKASAPHWYVLCKAGLVRMLERSAKVMDWWLLLGEGKLLFIFCKRAVFLFGISRITVSDFAEFSL